LSLFKVFNGNFVAASRLLFALGRRGLVDGRLGTVHARTHTPSTAIVWVGITTGACMFLGQAILVPISEVGSVASATGWMAACAAYFFLARSSAKRVIAGVGAFLGGMMILMKVVPLFPGHFTAYEWLALAVWMAVGVLLHWRSGAVSDGGVNGATEVRP
jgi:basic amino acid/polyamine antiporter, APA family